MSRQRARRISCPAPHGNAGLFTEFEDLLKRAATRYHDAVTAIQSAGGPLQSRQKSCPGQISARTPGE